MILIDFSGIALSGIHALAKDVSGEDFNEDFFRGTVLSSLRSHKVRFAEYGDLVICLDKGPYWRKEVMHEYKANRKKAKEKSTIDWSEVYTWMDNIILDLQTLFPFPVLVVDSCEADDIIAVLCQKYHSRETNLIISNDQDLLQLQRYQGVKQYSPMKKSFISSNNTIKELGEKVLRGDSGDGVPSIKCDNDHFVKEEKTRAKPMKKAEVELWSSLSGLALMEALPKEYHKNYIRNKKLIDLSYIPQHLVDKILEDYDRPANPYSCMRLLAYFSKHKLRRMAEMTEDFKQ